MYVFISGISCPGQGDDGDATFAITHCARNDVRFICSHRLRHVLHRQAPQRLQLSSISLLLRIVPRCPYAPDMHPLGFREVC